jgi:phosphoglucomutase
MRPSYPDARANHREQQRGTSGTRDQVPGTLHNTLLHATVQAIVLLTYNRGFDAV